MRQKKESRLNSVKNADRITKQWRSFENIISTLYNLWSDTDTINKPTESIIQGIPALSTETLKDTFLHLVGYISDFTDLKKYTVVVKIVWRWGQLIMEEGAIIIAEVEDGVREGVIAYMRFRQMIEWVTFNAIT